MENKVLSFFPDMVAIEKMDFLLATLNLLEGFSVLFVTKTAVPLFFWCKTAACMLCEKKDPSGLLPGGMGIEQGSQSRPGSRKESKRGNVPRKPKMPPFRVLPGFRWDSNLRTWCVFYCTATNDRKKKNVILNGSSLLDLEHGIDEVQLAFLKSPRL